MFILGLGFGLGKGVWKLYSSGVDVSCWLKEHQPQEPEESIQRVGRNHD